MPFSSRIANTILATPFDGRAATQLKITQQLTEKEFLEECYSYPIFSTEYQKEIKNKISGIELPEETATEISSLTPEDLEDQMDRMEKSYDYFLKWKMDFSANRVYTINGNAGVGKTTFINHSRYYDKDVQWIILDIYLANSYIDWISDVRTTIDNFDKADSKIYGSIILKIWESVFNGNDENGNYSFDKIDENITKLLKSYKEKYHKKTPVGRLLLDELNKALLFKFNKKKRVEIAAEIFKKHFNGKIGKNREGVINALNSLLLILKCMSDNLDSKFIIVFDNFERFIGKDEIYNKDVNSIRIFLNSYVGNLNMSSSHLNRAFKFILAVRDSTARICNVRLHASDVEPSNLELTDWYDTNNIISRKMNWYKEHNIEVENSELLEQIISDLRKCRGNTLTGLKLMINPLFNDNKRLILDFIGTMIELPSNQEGLRKYKELWDIDTPISRFAARSIIRGMILHHFEIISERFFEHLHTYSCNKKNINGLGYARKILTILYNNVEADQDNEMPLNNVLSPLFNGNVLECWNSS